MEPKEKPFLTVESVPWEIHLFGEIEVLHLGSPLPPLNLKKAIHLLCFLATRSSASRDQVSTVLWPGEYIEIARDRLRQTLAVLQKHLRGSGGQNLIEASRTHLKIRSSECTIDLVTCQRCIESAIADSSKERKVAELLKAFSYIKGSIASEIVEDWLNPIRDKFETDILSASVKIVEGLASDEEWRLILDVTESALTHYPLHEKMQLWRIEALSNTGSESEALLAATAFEQNLKKSLGLAPSANFAEQVNTLNQSVRSRARKGSSEPDENWHGITRFVDRFFGREVELDRLATIFVSKLNRLVTITGTGGAGKTRLSVEFLSQPVAKQFDRTIVLGLADCDSASQLQYVLAESLQIVIEETTEVGRIFSPHLGQSETLLVCDNCEHLLPDLTEHFKSLLTHCPKLYILCSSRTRLGIRGEAEIKLEPLTIPHSEHGSEPENFPALQLLIDRIQRRDHTYDPSDEEKVDLISLCRILDGLPLALELAASHVGLLSVSQLRVQLDGRAVELSNDQIDLPDRQSGLRNTLEWGYDKLSDETRRVFANLAVFQGRWTIDDATAVCQASDILPALETLTNLNLVSTVANTSPRRFRMLEMVRQFAISHLNDEEQRSIHERYFDHYFSKAKSLGHTSTQQQPTSVAGQFALDLSHFRANIRYRIRHESRLTEASEFIRLTQSPAISCGLMSEWTNYMGAMLPYEKVIETRIYRRIWAMHANNIGFFDSSQIKEEHIQTLANFVEQENDPIERWSLIYQLVHVIIDKEVPEYAPLAEKMLDSLDQENMTVKTQMSVCRLRAGLALMKSDFEYAVEQLQLAKGSSPEEGVEKLDRTMTFLLSMSQLRCARPNDYLETLTHGIAEIKLADDQVALAFFARVLLFAISELDVSGRYAKEATILYGFESDKRSRLRLRQYAYEDIPMAHLEEWLSAHSDDRFDELVASGTRLTLEQATSEIENLVNRLVSEPRIAL